VLAAERPLLLRLLRGRGLPPEEAEDVVQEMWLKLPALAGGPIRDPVAYLCRMAVNLAADRRLAAARLRRRGEDWHAAQPEAADHPTAEDALIAADEWRRAQAVLAAMPPRMKEALQWFRLERLGQREIAERLGITVSGVEKLLKRGYAELARGFGDGAGSAGRRRLEGEGSGDEQH
jgi:RNA polymerase sigma-70 factor (ECF subfamily)